MNQIKKYRFPIIVAAVLLLLVVIRLTGNNFRPDAEKWAEPSFDKSNLITSPDQLPEGDVLLVSLGEGTSKYIETAEEISVDPDGILNRDNIRIIKKHRGPVVLYSSDLSVSARIWMTLAQMGIRNLYIAEK